MVDAETQRHGRTHEGSGGESRRLMRVLIVTDAWHPQVNGVVQSLTETAKAARELGAQIEFLTPDGFFTLPLPTYPDIRLALVSPAAIARRMETAATSHVHIATE